MKAVKTQKELETAARAKGLIVGWPDIAAATGFTAATLRVYHSTGSLKVTPKFIGKRPSVTAAQAAKIADQRK